MTNAYSRIAKRGLFLAGLLALCTAYRQRFCPKQRPLDLNPVRLSVMDKLPARRCT